MNKIVNIIKPTGMTSHDVVSVVRKILNTKKKAQKLKYKNFMNESNLKSANRI